MHSQILALTRLFSNSIANKSTMPEVTAMYIMPPRRTTVHAFTAIYANPARSTRGPLQIDLANPGSSLRRQPDSARSPARPDSALCALRSAIAPARADFPQFPSVSKPDRPPTPRHTRLCAIPVRIHASQINSAAQNDASSNSALVERTTVSAGAGSGRQLAWRCRPDTRNRAGEMGSARSAGQAQRKGIARVSAPGGLSRFAAGSVRPRRLEPARAGESTPFSRWTRAHCIGGVVADARCRGESGNARRPDTRCVGGLQRARACEPRSAWAVTREWQRAGPQGMRLVELWRVSGLGGSGGGLTVFRRERLPCTCRAPCVPRADSWWRMGGRAAGGGWRLARNWVQSQSVRGGRAGLTAWRTLTESVSRPLSLCGRVRRVRTHSHESVGRLVHGADNARGGCEDECGQACNWGGGEHSDFGGRGWRMGKTTRSRRGKKAVGRSRRRVTHNVSCDLFWWKFRNILPAGFILSGLKEKVGRRWR
ncbi:hypothetical protein C8R43DRAFT_1189773 [Mycena crocata]|nr:hypothetical protein C8R43DRAFT_1189773 [Mycena crocata]